MSKEKAKAPRLPKVNASLVAVTSILTLRS